MSTTIVIQGFGSNDKVPGAVTQVKYGAGLSKIGTSTLTLVLVAQKSTLGGTAALDTEVFDIRTLADAEAKAGQGSELALAAEVALRRNVRLKGITSTIATPTAATATITVGSTWTTAGAWRIRINGTTLSAGILAADDKVDVAAAIAAAITAKPRLPVTAAVGGSPGVNDHIVTLTWKTPGARGNKAIVAVDKTDLPTGATMVAAGGASVTGGGVYFHNGAATEDITTTLATLGVTWYNYFAAAQSDATNLGLWRDFLDTQADPFHGMPSFLVFANNGSLSATASLAQNDCNDPFMQCVWMLNGESHPTQVAAAMAALRCESEQQNPNAGYDDAELLGIAPLAQGALADNPDRGTKQAALDEGVTPLYSTTDGHVLVTRSITTLSLQGTDPYYGTLDTAEAVVPQYVRRRFRARWNAFKAVNPYLRSEPAPEEPTPPQGVATPSRWNSEVVAEERLLEDQLQITETEANPPTTEFDDVANRFMTAAPVKVLKQQHAIGISVEQLAS